MKKICSILLILALMISLVGCNYQMIDTNYSFNYAYLSLPNGECIEGPVDSWRDYDDGDQIQVTINGTVYLTDTTRCVLVKQGE